MATIEELLEQDAQIVEAERDALHNLADHLRTLAVGLPQGSVLARRFAVFSESFDSFADNARMNPATWGTLTLVNFTREVAGDLDEIESEEDD